MEPQVHYQAWEKKVVVKPWKPVATYAILATMVAVYGLQLLSLGRSVEFHHALWAVASDWPTRPWSPITSTFAHGGPSHLFWNGLMLFFFGPHLERIIGRRDFVLMILVAGAVSGILQAEVSLAWGDGRGALGISGALMFLFGTLLVLFPNNTLLLYGIIPLKFWMAALLFAASDILGAFDPTSDIGVFAHLAGMAIGIAFGLGLRRNPNRYGGRGGQPIATR